jgi:hypothetical protein
VTVGGTAPISVVVVCGKTITATTPAGSAGTASVLVATWRRPRGKYAVHLRDAGADGDDHWHQSRPEPRRRPALWW